MDMDSQRPPVAKKACLGLIDDDMKNTNNEALSTTCGASKKEKKNIFNLPDEILLKIYEFLSINDLLQIAKTSSRLHELSLSPELWKKVDVDNPVISYSTLCRIINRRVHQKTDEFRLVSTSHGDNMGFSKSAMLPSSLLFNLCQKASNLTKLNLVRQKIDGHSFLLTMLPRSLKVLNLTDSYVNVQKYVTVPNDEQPYLMEEAISYFKDIDKHLVNLEDLDLSHCNWIVPYDLMYLRKLEKLTRLSLRGCSFTMSKIIPKIFDDSPATMRLKWRRVFSCLASGGFFKLKILDLTNCNLPDAFRNILFNCLALGSVHVYDESNNRCIPRKLDLEGVVERQLEELYLGNYDDVVSHVSIHYHGKLKVLDVSGSTVVMVGIVGPSDKAVVHFCDDELVDELRRLCPNCVIERVAAPTGL